MESPLDGIVKMHQNLKDKKISSTELVNSADYKKSFIEDFDGKYAEFIKEDKSKNDYLKQNNLYLDEFATLDEHDYETLVRLMRQFDKMIEADDDLFEFTNDFIDSKTYESGAYLERYFNEIYTFGEDMFPEAAEIAHHIEKLVHKAWSGDDYKSTF